MVWAATAVGAAGVINSAYQGSQNRKAAKKLADQQSQLGTGEQTAAEQLQADKDSQMWAVDQNKANQLWANEINQGNLMNQLQQNRLDWGREGFGSGTFDEATGRYDISLDPSQKANLDAIRRNQAAGLGAMKTGFDVNSDVMNAYRGLQQPLVQEARDRENARLAAMGLSTGSGSAWQTAQRSLNDAQTRADQNAILAGFQADQSLQQNNRANLGTMGQMESGMLAGMNTPTYAQMGTSQVSAPTVTSPKMNLMGGWAADQSMAQNNYNASAAGNAANAAGWQGLISGAGNALGGAAKDAGGWGNLLGFGGSTGSPQGSFIGNADNGVATASPVANPYAGMTSTPLP